MTGAAGKCRRLLATAEGGPHYEAIYLALATGLRRGELLALRWSDIDLDRRELRVRRTVREIPGQGSVVMEPKTPRSRRPVALSEQAVGVLRSHRVQQHERRLKLGEAWVDHDLVFPTAVGTPWVARNMLRGFWKAAESAGLERLTFHTRRHSAASLMAQAGVPVTSISAQLGHANPSVTQSIYSHVLPGMQDEAAQRLAVVLGH